MSRLSGKVLRNFIEEEYSLLEIKEQASFQAGSCLDHIFSLTERRIFCLSILTVPVQKLWQVLERSRFNVTLIAAVRQLYDHSTSKIKLNNKISDSFPVTKGLTQGCCLSYTV